MRTKSMWVMWVCIWIALGVTLVDTIFASREAYRDRYAKCMSVKNDDILCTIYARGR